MQTVWITMLIFCMEMGAVHPEFLPDFTKCPKLEERKEAENEKTSDFALPDTELAAGSGSLWACQCAEHYRRGG